MFQSHAFDQIFMLCNNVQSCPCLAELNEKGAWSQLNYSNNFEPFCRVKDSCERVSVKECSPLEFIEKYESKYKPVVIQGVQEEWKANYKWTIEVCNFQTCDFVRLSLSISVCYFGLCFSLSAFGKEVSKSKV